MLLGRQSVESLRVHPDYLLYFNQIAAERPEDFLVGSDLDWGQDLLRLEATAKDLQIEKLYLVYSGSADPAFFDFPELADIATGERPSGWLAVSLTSLKSREPYTLVGKSIRLYHFPDEKR